MVYRLFGGSLGDSARPDAGALYSGPRGVRVRGVLDDGEAERARQGALMGAHVVVGTPACLLAAGEGGAPVPTPGRSPWTRRTPAPR